jgi:excinuclease ABC subunit A
LPCEACEGTRYKLETLEVQVEGKSIADVLDLDIEAALDYFKTVHHKLAQKILDKIQPLHDIGLGYLKLGQSSSTLSGGEAQRVKLASFLAKGKNTPSTLFIFDEPTTGLHFHDINKLVIALNALINIGHSVLVIEHNLEVIKCADYIIDLGPEGGNKGGNLLYAGTPEGLCENPDSFTGQHLKEKL